MKLETLIKNLQELLKEHGNIDVVTSDFCGYDEDVEVVEYGFNTFDEGEVVKIRFRSE